MDSWGKKIKISAMEESRPGLLRIQELSKRFGGQIALDSLTLAMERGESLALLGPNGAGKTTAIRLVMGQLVPDRGEARVLGRDCFREHPEVMKVVGYVPDEPTFLDHLLGWELVHFAGRMRGMDPARVQERAGALAERWDFLDGLGQEPSTYSKGMRRKLALILALLHEPALLLLDEPTIGLDPIATEVLREVLEEERRRGTGVFLSTQLMDRAERMASRVAILVKGKLSAAGPLEELKSQFAPGGDLEDLFLLVVQSQEAKEEAL